MSETPTQPEIPSAKDIVALAGKEPDALAGLKGLELQALAMLKETWSKKATRDWLANGLYALIGAIFPGAAKSIILQQLEPAITAILETGSK